MTPMFNTNAFIVISKLANLASSKALLSSILNERRLAFLFSNRLSEVDFSLRLFTIGRIKSRTVVKLYLSKKSCSVLRLTTGTCLLPSGTLRTNTRMAWAWLVEMAGAILGKTVFAVKGCWASLPLVG